MSKAELLIVGLGEALFDVFDQGEKLGGAPLNVAMHATQLGKQFGVSGAVGSRVGDDDRGKQVAKLLEKAGQTDSVLQIDPEFPTGVVTVELKNGSPSYTIEPNAAWDFIAWEANLKQLATKCDAVCFGSLAQRESQSRESIRAFLQTAENAIRLYDVNLRKPFIDLSVLEESCLAASAVKCNDEELATLLTATGFIDDPDSKIEPKEWIPQLMKKYSLQFFLLTQGQQGCRLFTAEGDFQGDVPKYSAEKDADTVGAGDSTAAATLLGFLLKWPPQTTVRIANAIGAYVASRSGATPELPDEFLKQIADTVGGK